MRTWIYNRITALPLPAGMATRVTSSGNADNPVRPFITLAMGPEQPVLGMPAEAAVQRVPFDVILHDKPGSMLNIDDAAVTIKNSLPTPDGAVVGNMSVYECRWDMTSSDGYDDHYGTNTRTVSFILTTHRKVS